MPLDCHTLLGYAAKRNRSLGVGPADRRRDRKVRGIHATRQVPIMLANGFGFLALLSLISILFGDAARRKSDPQVDGWFWMRYRDR
jgi:hypothetical protein